MSDTVPLRRLTSMSYGDALNTETRVEGDTPVFSSGGKTGSHNRPNTEEPVIVVGRKGSHGSVWWSDAPAFVIDTAYSIDHSNTPHNLRWLYYVLQSMRLNNVSSDVGIPGLSRDAALSTHAPAPPSLEEQRRIADFLDDQVARIDAIIEARRAQADAAGDAFQRAVLDIISGQHLLGPRKDSGLTWLGDVPQAWPVLPVSTQFETMLGKMLDASRQTGERALPYLRNTNVQWDRIDTFDLKVMDIPPSEYVRYTVRAGDLLICEGGQPGRAAIWDGHIEVVGFQKALHRARSRGRSSAKWLLNCLRAAVAMNAFAGENGVTTISHLTGEQLRSQRFPFPDPSVQLSATDELDGALAQRDEILGVLAQSVERLTEYKQSLVTAAVSGNFDVTTASNRSVPAWA